MKHISNIKPSTARRLGWLAVIMVAVSACGGGADSTSATVAAVNTDVMTAKASTSPDAGKLATEQVQTAFDADGNALAVWPQPNDAYSELWFSWFTAASGWSGAALLARGNGNAKSPQVTVDASGNTWVVWQQSDGLTDNIWVNRFSAASNAWGTATLIESNNGGNASAPQIAGDSSGNMLVVWQHSDGTRDSIWANRFDAAANSWGAGAPIETDDTGTAFDPQVLVDFNGHAVAAWSRRDSARGNIWTSRYLAGKGWAAPVQLEAVTQSAHKPQISFDASGNTWVSWQDHSPVSANSETLVKRYSFDTD